MIGEFSNRLLFKIRSEVSWPLRWAKYREAGGESVRQAEFPLALAQRLKPESLRFNLLYSDFLDPILWQAPTQAVRVLDLGSRNFAYCLALSRWLRGRGAEGDLVGVEIDPHRRYLNYYRRCDYAEYYVGLARHGYGPKLRVSYEPGDWLSYTPKASLDLIFCFFPFLFTDLHRGWGLPLKHFNPTAFYRKCLEQSPSLVFFHQGEEELAESLRILSRLGGGVRKIWRVESSPWLELKIPTYGLEIESPRFPLESQTLH